MIDPETGEIPEDPLAGVLPPNDPETHCGEGYVTFTVRGRDDVPTGTEIINTPTIIFDNNEPIETNEAFNTVDADAPVSDVDPLTPQLHDPNIPLTWSGQDPEGGSGLAGFTVYVSTDDGPFAPFVAHTLDTDAIFEGECGHKYAFYSLGIDNVGNIEDPPDQPDAITTLCAASAASQAGPLGTKNRYLSFVGGIRCSTWRSPAAS